MRRLKGKCFFRRHDGYTWYRKNVGLNFTSVKLKNENNQKKGIFLLHPLSLYKMSYRVCLENAKVGRLYQLNAKDLFEVRNDHIDADRVRNLQSLVREPHKLKRKGYWQNGIYPYYTYDFELTEADRENDAQEYKNGTLMDRRNNIQINSYYRYEINKLEVEDVKAKKIWEKKRKVIQFLEKAIGPNKICIYAPPGEYGEKGGLLYRASLKTYTQKKEKAR